MSKETRANQRIRTRNIVKKYHGYKEPWSEVQFFSVFHELQPDIEVCSEFVNMDIPLTCYCKIHDYRWNIIPRTFVADGNGCPICARKSNGKRYALATKGVDDVATLYPHLIQYFKNKEEAYSYKRQSNQKVNLICPRCNTEKCIAIYLLTSRGFSCSLCGDGVSYPNKVGRMFVMQLPVEDVEFEWCPEWLPGLKRFDIKFRFQSQIYVMEMDGYQHYVEDLSFTHKKLSEIKAEDKLKDDLCEKNGVIIFRIDCRNSTLEWIRNQIIHSDLSDLFDLELIDWERCDIYANNSLVIETGKLWNDGMDLLQISQELKISRSTIQRYIKIANNIGICKYDKQRGLENGIRKNSNRIRWIDANQEFVNCRECVEKVFEQTGIKLSESGVRSAAYGKYRHTKGLHFEFCDIEIDELEKDKLLKSVCCYDMAGTYITAYNSIIEAFEEINVLPQSIIDCCDGKTKKSGNRVWKYADEVEQGTNLIIDLTQRGISVDCLTLDGEYIETFPSAMVAIRKYTKATNSGIGRCCKGKQKASGGYRWRYSDV